MLLSEKVLHITNHIIIPTLETIGYGGRADVELVLGTGLKESLLTHRRQLGGGPALGLWQMEPVTFYDIWKNYLGHRLPLKNTILKLIDNEKPDHHQLIENDCLAAAMCRIHYLRVQQKLPSAGALHDQAEYWKRYYNTNVGKGMASDYVKLWKESVDNIQLQNLMK